MKTLIKNIKPNKISLVSGGDGYCGCSNIDGSKKSEIKLAKGRYECQKACYSSEWEVAHFIAGFTRDSKPISKFCHK